MTQWREGNQHATFSNFPTSLSFSRQGGEESASILNGSSSLAAAFRNNLCSFMLSIAAHKSFSSTCLTFVRINRLYCSRFQSHSIFPQHMPGLENSSAYIYIYISDDDGVLNAWLKSVPYPGLWRYAVKCRRYCSFAMPQVFWNLQQ